MRIVPRIFAVPMIALLLLSSACEVPRPRPVGRDGAETTGRAVGGETIDPADVHLDGLLETKDMKVLWRQSLGQVAEGTTLRQICLTKDLLLAETPDGTLFYFNSRSGVWKTSTRLKGTLWVPPLLVGEKLFALTTRGLLVIDARSGLLQNQMPPRLPVVSKPVYYKESLILGGGNGKMLRLGVEDGGHLWVRSAGGSIDTAPVLVGDTLYAAGYKGQAVSIDAAGGEKLWSWEPKEPSQIVSGAAYHEGSVYVGDNRGFLYSLSAQDGVVMWKYPVGAPVVEAPAVFEKGLLVFTYKSEAHALKVGREAELLWSHPDAVRLLATGKKLIYVLTRKGALAALDPDSGDEKWRLPLAGKAQVVSDPDTSTMYIARPDGHIVAITELD